MTITKEAGDSSSQRSPVAAWQTPAPPRPQYHNHTTLAQEALYHSFGKQSQEASGEITVVASCAEDH
ncbi:MAG: hypothetical protein QF599_00140 [Planctomycetota bacterium]|nr:hypothetical protein [Planctomycetota bacterium]MDP6954351.1 hypothetical protein [Planctomycetota bacterium]